MRVGNLDPPIDLTADHRGPLNQTTIPHLAFPFQISTSGNAVQLEQDSDDEIINCVELISSVVQSTLIDEPEFGITDPTFMINSPPHLIAAHIKEWEPRATIEAVESPDGEDLSLDNIIVRVKTRGA